MAGFSQVNGSFLAIIGIRNLPTYSHSRTTLEPISVEHLEALANGLVDTKKTTTFVSGPVETKKRSKFADAFPELVRTPLDIKLWFDRHSVAVQTEKPFGGGTLYVVSVCPWNPEHKGSFYVAQFGDGSVMARCHHASCQGKGWVECRDFYEPNWREKPGNLAPLEKVTDPSRLALMCLFDLWCHSDGWTLRRWHEAWYLWNGWIYRELPEEELDGALHIRIKREFDRQSIEAQKRQQSAFSATANTITGGLLANVKLAIQSHVMIPSALEVPCWLGAAHAMQACDMLVGTNALFHLPSLAEGKYEPILLSPIFFTTFGLDYPILQTTTPPARWLGFLASVLPDDQEARETLQEFMGYLLTHDTHQQKMMVWIGPTRSGKGTSGRIISAMLGTHNVAAQQLSSLRGDFGLEPLLGKGLLLIPDARLQGNEDIIVSRLLSLTGDDLLTVNRKNKPAITLHLPTRIIVMTNVLPRLQDASGAIVNRMLLIHFSRSFFGKENPQLTEELKAEMSSILMWSIEGWRRLRSSTVRVGSKMPEKLPFWHSI